MFRPDKLMAARKTAAGRYPQRGPWYTFVQRGTRWRDGASVLTFGRNRWLIALATTFALLCSLVAPCIGVFSPSLNWDSLAYVGIIKSWSLPDPADFQAAAYKDVRTFAEAVRPGAYGKLIADSDYRRIVAADPVAFSDQLPFYRIRPLYVWVVGAVSAFTPTIASAGAAVSVLSALAINLLIVGIAFRRLGVWAGAGTVAVVGLSPLLTDLAQKSTPDGLFVLLVAVGVALLGKRRDMAGVLVLVASTAVRSEAMLLNALLALALLAERFAGSRKSSSLPSAILFFGSIAVGQTIARLAGAYGFRVLYSATFIGFAPHPAELAATSIPLSVILGAWKSGIVEGLANAGLWAVLAEAVLMAFALSRYHDRLPERPTFLAIGMYAYTLARLVLYPAHDLRLNAPVFVGMAILLIHVARPRHLPGYWGQRVWERSVIGNPG